MLADACVHHHREASVRLHATAPRPACTARHGGSDPSSGRTRATRRLITITPRSRAARDRDDARMWPAGQSIVDPIHSPIRPARQAQAQAQAQASSINA